MFSRYLILVFLLAGLVLSACAPAYRCKPEFKPLPIGELAETEMREGAGKAGRYAFLGVAHRLIDTAEIKQTGVSQAYLVVWVVPDSPAEKIGLQVDDVILQFDGINLDAIAEQDRKIYLSQYIKHRKRIGDHLCLKVWRRESDIKVRDGSKILYLENKKELEQVIAGQEPDEKLSFTIDNRIRIIHYNVTLGDRKNLTAQDLPDNKELFPEYEKLAAPHEGLMRRLIQQYELEEQYRDIIRRYGEDELWDDGFRLNLFRYLHREPFKLVPVVEETTESLKNLSENMDLREILTKAAVLLDVPISPEVPVFIGDGSVQSYLDYIIQTVDRAWELRNQAFAGLSREEISYLEEELVLLFERFSQSYYIDPPDQNENTNHNRKIIELAGKVDFSSLFESAAMLTGLTDDQFLGELDDLLRASGGASTEFLEGVEGKVLYVLTSKAGPIIIGGYEPNVYRIPAAVILDVGGDDLYSGETALGQLSMPVSLIIDLKGKDEYVATELFAQGSSLMGSSLLFDAAGEDLYVGTGFSQASAVFGLGLLADLAGNDRYYGKEFNQGTAFWGAGILLDAAGDDYYQSDLFAQGVGGVKGLGVLLDNQGDDFYFAGGRNKSSYGTTGIFQGSSQGLGIGFRGYTSGGIGLLLDGSGSDSFWAGNFSQGTGYFFGLGILRNFGPDNDRYTASRYGQGAAAHSAAGILLDDGGNDYYSGYQVALQAAAWDLGIAALIDKQGDDIYNGSNGFSQAAAAHNGMAFFIDEAGSDHYSGEQARAGNNDYHGGSSLSFFIDNGGGQDVYTSGLNNSSSLHGEYGIRVDLQEAGHDIK